jgi:fatty acid desaturase
VIDRIGRVAQASGWLRIPSMATALACLMAIVALLIASDSRESDRYLMPAALGLLWSVSVYTFIALFRSVPAKPSPDWAFLGRLRRKMTRAWYWLLALLFVCTTAGALFVTVQMLRVWLDEYTA